MRIFVLAGFWLSALLLLVEAAKSNDAILLAKVKTLTLRTGKQTAHRRVSAIPQLRCIGGNAKGLYEVDAMRCTNVGSDYDSDDVQWTCQANLPSNFKLGSTEVMCEGYKSPNDPYILKGSCGVEYRLQLTESGEQKHGSRRQADGDFWVKALILIFIFGVIGYGIYDNCIRGTTRTGPQRPPFAGGWGGGGGDDNDNNDDPPPPYTAGSNSKGSGSSNIPGGSQQQGTRNAWAGPLAGAAAGYLAGRLGQNRRQEQRPRASPWGWGSRNQDTSNSYTRSSYGSTSSQSSSGSTHQSTGFGGTSRR